MKVLATTKVVIILQSITNQHVVHLKKSVTFSLAFSKKDGTLKDKEIDAAFARIVEQLKTQVGAQLR